jgi:hypothetical protein
MDTIKPLFEKTIDKYKNFIGVVEGIERDMSSLPAEEILALCEKVRKLQEEISPDDKKIAEIMSITGSDIMDTPFIGEYQRILDRAEHACESLSSKAHIHKAILADELRKIKKNQLGVSQYNKSKDISGSMLTKSF